MKLYLYIVGLTISAAGFAASPRQSSFQTLTLNRNASLSERLIACRKDHGALLRALNFTVPSVVRDDGSPVADPSMEICQRMVMAARQVEVLLSHAAEHLPRRSAFHDVSESFERELESLQKQPPQYGLVGDRFVVTYGSSVAGNAANVLQSIHCDITFNSLADDFKVPALEAQILSRCELEFRGLSVKRASVSVNSTWNRHSLRYISDLLIELL